MRALKTIGTVLLFLVISMVSGAQTVQEGKVKEYKGKNKKSSLSGVEVVITNASTTVSDRDGDFVLHFHTMKPGQKVKVRRIEKSGYEIFNMDALDQWNINPDEPFTIVMVRSDRFKKLRDEYSRVASESYELQYQKELGELEEERRQGRLTEEQLREEIEQLREFYDRQLETLDSYVDRFARIDLGELSSAEYDIITLVQEGRIEEAISKYEALNLVSRYEEVSSETEEIIAAMETLDKKLSQNQLSMDELWDSILRQLDTYLMRGGKASYSKITEIVDRLMACPMTDVWMRLQLLHYLNSKDDLVVFESINMDEIDDPQAQLMARYGYAINLYMAGDYEKALEHILKALELSYVIEDDSYLIELKCLEASIYLNQFKHDKAYQIYLELENAANDPDSPMSHENRMAVIEALIGYYQSIGRYDKSLLYSEQFCQWNKENYEAVPSQRNLTKYMLSQVTYGIMLSEVQRIDESIEILLSTIPVAEKLWLADPGMFFYNYMTINRSLGYSYFFKQDYVKSEMYFVQALDLIKRADEMNIYEMNDMNVSEIYSNLGYLYYTIGDLEKSEQAYLQSYAISCPVYQANPTNFVSIDTFCRLEINMAALYLQAGNYDKLSEHGICGLELCELLYMNYPEAYVFEYTMILRTLAEAEIRWGSRELAMQLLDRALAADPQDSLALALKGQLAQ